MIIIPIPLSIDSQKLTRLTSKKPLAFEEMTCRYVLASVAGYVSNSSLQNRKLNVPGML